VRREARAFLIIAVTTLTVVALPLLAAFVVHLNGVAIGTIGAAVAAVVGALATLTFSYSAGRAAGAAQAELEAQRAVYAKQIVLLTEGRAELRLLSELGAIEKEARSLLGERPSSSIVLIRSRVQDPGIWSAEDVYDFDNALRTRIRLRMGTKKD
jgi:hypothetical protein